jgi:hypothetical protein
MGAGSSGGLELRFGRIASRVSPAPSTIHPSVAPAAPAMETADTLPTQITRSGISADFVRFQAVEHVIEDHEAIARAKNPPPSITLRRR